MWKGKKRGAAGRIGLRSKETLRQKIRPSTEGRSVGNELLAATRRETSIQAAVCVASAQGLAAKRQQVRQRSDLRSIRWFQNCCFQHLNLHHLRLHPIGCG